MSFGARVITLDRLEQHEQRLNRPLEYQYRFIRITDSKDPIFRGMANPSSNLWQDYTTEARVLRVWQNHGLQLDRLPEGFSLLATSYLCRNQMMVSAGKANLFTRSSFIWKSLLKTGTSLAPAGNIKMNPATGASSSKTSSSSHWLTNPASYDKPHLNNSNDNGKRCTNQY